jgi:CheY-like chemotaxis protein
VASTVLVVDGVAESQASTSVLLTAEGYDVSSVPDVEQALKSVDERRPTAILFQILDPAKGVIEFVRRLALSRAGKGVPVVVLTALNEFQLGSFLNGVPGVRRVVYSPSPPEALLGALALAVKDARR